MAYYWKLVYGAYDDLKTIMVPPEPKNAQGLTPIQVVKKRWENNQPVHTSQASISPHEIREFSPTDTLYTDQVLLEAGARAFREPLQTNMGSVRTMHNATVQYKGVASKWVKQITTKDKWERYYSRIDSYHKLYDDGMVTMAFRKAVHDIDPMITPECSENEVYMLTKNS